MINRDLKNYRYRMPRHRMAVAWDIVVTWARVVFMAVAFYAGIFVWLI